MVVDATPLLGPGVCRAVGDARGSDRLRVGGGRHAERRSRGTGLALRPRRQPHHRLPAPHPDPPGPAARGVGVARPVLAQRGRASRHGGRDLPPRRGRRPVRERAPGLGRGGARPLPLLGPPPARRGRVRRLERPPRRRAGRDRRALRDRPLGRERVRDDRPGIDRGRGRPDAARGGPRGADDRPARAGDRRRPRARHRRSPRSLAARGRLRRARGEPRRDQRPSHRARGDDRGLGHVAGSGRPLRAAPRGRGPGAEPGRDRGRGGGRERRLHPAARGLARPSLPERRRPARDDAPPVRAPPSRAGPARRPAGRGLSRPPAGRRRAPGRRRPRAGVGRPGRRRRARARRRLRRLAAGRVARSAGGLRGADDPPRRRRHAAGPRRLPAVRRLLRPRGRARPGLDRGRPPAGVRAERGPGRRPRGRDRPRLAGPHRRGSRRADALQRRAPHPEPHRLRPGGERVRPHARLLDRLEPAGGRDRGSGPGDGPGSRRRAHPRDGPGRGREPRELDAALRGGPGARRLRLDRLRHVQRPGPRPRLLGRPLGSRRPLRAEPGGHRPGRALRRVPRRRDPRRHAAEGRAHQPGRGGLRHGAWPRPGVGVRREPRVVARRGRAGPGGERVPVGADGVGHGGRRGRPSRGVGPAAAGRALHPAADRSRPGRARGEHPRERRRGHDPARHADRPRGEGRAGERHPRPGAGLLERERRARPRGLRDPPRRGGAPRGDPGADRLGRRRARGGDLRLLGAGRRPGRQPQPAREAAGAGRRHASGRDLLPPRRGRVRLGRGRGEGHGLQRRRLRRVPAARRRRRGAGRVDAAAALDAAGGRGPPRRLAGPLERTVPSRARGRGRERQLGPGHAAGRRRHRPAGAARPHDRRQGAGSRRLAATRVGAEPVPGRGGDPGVPQRSPRQRGVPGARRPRRVPGARPGLGRPRAAGRGALLPRRGDGRRGQRFPAVRREVPVPRQPRAAGGARAARPRQPLWRRRAGRRVGRGPRRGPGPVRAPGRGRHAVGGHRRGRLGRRAAHPAVGGDARPGGARPRAGPRPAAGRRHRPLRQHRPRPARDHGHPRRHGPASRATRPRRARGRRRRRPRVDARVGPRLRVVPPLPRRAAGRGGIDRAAPHRRLSLAGHVRVRGLGGGRGRQRGRDEPARRSRRLRAAPPRAGVAARGRDDGRAERRGGPRGDHGERAARGPGGGRRARHGGRLPRGGRAARPGRERPRGAGRGRGREPEHRLERDPPDLERPARPRDRPRRGCRRPRRFARVGSGRGRGSSRLRGAPGRSTRHADGRPGGCRRGGGERRAADGGDGLRPQPRLRVAVRGGDRRVDGALRRPRARRVLPGSLRRRPGRRGELHGARAVGGPLPDDRTGARQRAARRGAPAALGVRDGLAAGPARVAGAPGRGGDRRARRHAGRNDDVHRSRRAGRPPPLRGDGDRPLRLRGRGRGRRGWGRRRPSAGPADGPRRGARGPGRGPHLESQPRARPRGLRRAPRRHADRHRPDPRPPGSGPRQRDLRLHRDRGRPGRARERRVGPGQRHRRRPARPARPAGHPGADRRGPPDHARLGAFRRGRPGGRGHDGRGRGRRCRSRRRSGAARLRAHRACRAAGGARGADAVAGRPARGVDGLRGADRGARPGGWGSTLRARRDHRPRRPRVLARRRAPRLRAVRVRVGRGDRAARPRGRQRPAPGRGRALRDRVGARRHEARRRQARGGRDRPGDGGRRVRGGRADREDLRVGAVAPLVARRLARGLHVSLERRRRRAAPPRSRHGGVPGRGLGAVARRPARVVARRGPPGLDDRRRERAAPAPLRRASAGNQPARSTRRARRSSTPGSRPTGPG